MNGPIPRSEVKRANGWSLLKHRPRPGSRLAVHLLVTRNGNACAAPMKEKDCVELATLLLEHARDLRKERTKK